jgi:hypothetical protein
MSYFQWFQSSWVNLIPYTLLAIVGIILSLMHLGKKSSFAVFSLIAYILGLLNSWIFSYLQMNAIYKYQSASSGIIIFGIVNLVLSLIASVFLMVAIFSGRKGTIQPPRYTPYQYNPTLPQQPYTTAAQVQGYPQVPQQPQYPQQPPQPPQNPPTLQS